MAQPISSGRLASVALTIGGVVASLVILNNADLAFLWIGGLWIVVLVLTILSVRREAVRLACLSSLAVVVSLTGAEGFLALRSESPVRRIQKGTDERWVAHHPVLGYSLKPDRTVLANPFLGDREIYRAIYSIGSNGLRRSNAPNLSDLEPEVEVLFFGGSFTFGEGLNDSESLPYKVSERSMGRCRTLNFGAPGYGPHQMYAQLQHGIVEQELEDQQPAERAIAIYSLIWGHGNRAAGDSEWDEDGPSYELDERDELHYAGSFSEVFVQKRYSHLLRKLRKSHIYQAVMDSRFRGFDPGDHPELILALVSGAGREFKRLFPAGRFLVVVWDRDAAAPGRAQWLDTVRGGLRSRGIQHVAVSEIIPGYRDAPERFHIDDDGHPNGAANGIIASRLVDWILEGEALP